MRFASSSVLLGGVCCLLSGCDINGMPSTPASAAPQQIVGVSGNHMTLNGSPWLSRGVGLQALVEPSALLLNGTDPGKAAAVQIYGVPEFNAIKAFGADTIRFQISQPGLDPQNDVRPPDTNPYDPTYLAEIIADVKLARQSNFVVLLCMQDEIPISGETVTHNLATAETQSDWDLLNAAFANDRGVMYELYNEPHLMPTAANWALWANGDTTGTDTPAPGAVGMQSMITHLRDAGSQNVFVLDGLNGAKSLAGLPAISDPLNQIVYAVHPYFDGSSDESQWDTNFDVLSQTLPVWVDEWSAGSDMAIGLGKPPGAFVTNYQISVDFLNYLSLHSIPLCAGAFDIPGFMTQSDTTLAYTNYDFYMPSVPGDNAGQLVFHLFLNNYSPNLTLADGL